MPPSLGILLPPRESLYARKLLGRTKDPMVKGLQMLKLEQACPGYCLWDRFGVYSSESQGTRLLRN